MEWMKKQQAISFRICMIVVFSWFEFLFLFVFGALINANPISGLLWILAICGQFFLLRAFLWVLCSWPWVSFSEDTVSVMIFLKTRQYHWQEICQAGVLRLHRNGHAYPDFVILLPGGSRRKYKDKFFRLRNIGKLITIPYTPAINTYITSHYGPLDFDLWNNPEEKSTVIDSP